MTMAKPTIAVVKVIRGFGKSLDDPVPAIVLTRKGQKEEQYLSPDTVAAMGDQIVAYFEAEKVDGKWWIGQRLPNGDRGW